MKILILIRHATAEADTFLKDDFERELDPSGVFEAEKLGDFIKLKGVLPQSIFSSPAKRTVETAKISASKYKFCSDRIMQNMKLYNAGFQKLMEEVAKAESAISVLAVVAHNPGISQMATALVKSGNYQLSPSSAISLKFNIKNWSELKAGTGTENWYYYP